MLSTGCRSIGPWPGTGLTPQPVVGGIAELFDTARARTVPIRVWSPAAAVSAPVVVLSHGMGENRDTSSWLAEEWAARGYWVVSLTHRGSDREVLEMKGISGIIAATRKPETWRNRPLDVTFVLDQIARRSEEIPHVSGADPSRVAVAGHSAGAFTAAALAGLPAGDTAQLKDERVSAIIAMSMPKLDTVVPPDAWSGIDVPALHVTGTMDVSIQYWTFPRHRRIPFENAARRGDQYLVTLRGATHSTYSNEEATSARGRRLHAAVSGVTSIFLDGWLGGNGTAREQLESIGAIEGIRVERR